MPGRYRVQNSSAFPTIAAVADPCPQCRDIPARRHPTEECQSMSANRSILRAGLLRLAVLDAAGAAYAGQCPAGKVVAGGQGQQAGATMPKGVTDIGARLDRPRHPAAVTSRTASSACAGSRSSPAAWCLAQPRRPPGDHLRRRGRGHRIRQQLRGADRAQGRRGRAERHGHLALVEEHRQDDGRAALGRPAARAATDAHMM